MTSIKELREKHAEPVNGHHAYAIDYRPGPRSKVRRVVRFATSIHEAAQQWTEVLRSERMDKAVTLRVIQLSGPVRVYKLGEGVAA